MNQELLELAKNGKEIFAAFVLPFAVLWLTKLKWKTEYKFAAALGLSVLAGFFTAVADDKLTATTVTANVMVIFTIAQTVYMTFFKALGLESVLLPQAGVVDKATQQVKNQLGDLSDFTAKQILDPTSSTTVQVKTKIEESS